MLPQYAPELPEHEMTALATVAVPIVTVDESKEMPAEMLPVGIWMTESVTMLEVLVKLLPLLAIRYSG